MFNQFSTVGPRWSTDDGGGSSNNTNENADDSSKGAGDPADTPEFLTWLEKQPQDIKDLYEKQVHGLKSALKKERDTAKDVPTMKKKLADYAKNEEDARKAQMSKEEALTTDLDQTKVRADLLHKENQKLLIERDVERWAAKLAFTDPADALRLIPADAITITDEKVVEGVEKALTKLAKDKPYLLKQTTEKPRGNVTEKRKGEKPEKDESTLKLPAATRL
jgi:hypothetical protein